MEPLKLQHKDEAPSGLMPSTYKASLIDRMRGIIKQAEVVTFDTLLRVLPGENPKMVQTHLMHLLDYGEVLVVHEIAGQKIPAYVWNKDYRHGTY